MLSMYSHLMPGMFRARLEQDAQTSKQGQVALDHIISGPVWCIDLDYNKNLSVNINHIARLWHISVNAFTFRYVQKVDTLNTN